MLFRASFRFLTSISSSIWKEYQEFLHTTRRSVADTTDTDAEKARTSYQAKANGQLCEFDVLDARGLFEIVETFSRWHTFPS